ncbi:MAG: hypothetical protein R2911_21805 [Caldilineaceae bacterium]
MLTALYMLGYEVRIFAAYGIVHLWRIGHLPYAVWIMFQSNTSLYD